jgi:hypothetical protein
VATTGIEALRARVFGRTQWNTGSFPSLVFGDRKVAVGQVRLPKVQRAPRAPNARKVIPRMIYPGLRMFSSWARRFDRLGGEKATNKNVQAGT